jgi:hypothetical protein
MARPAAPSMPTAQQIKQAYEAIIEFYPGARIRAVGPEGVVFGYPEAAATLGGRWDDKPFSGG